MATPLQRGGGHGGGPAGGLCRTGAGFAYTYDLSQPAGARISRMLLHGQPLADAATVRVALSNYLAGGGDNFTVFAQAPALWSGGQDLGALEAYFRTHGPVVVPSIHGLLFK